MRYVIDIEDGDSLTVGDTGDRVLEITVDDVAGDLNGAVFKLNEQQLNELLTAIELIKALRPKKSINVDTTHVPGQQLPYYPPGVRTAVYRDEVQRSGPGSFQPQDWGYSATCPADNPTD